MKEICGRPIWIAPYALLSYLGNKKVSKSSYDPLAAAAGRSEESLLDRVSYPLRNPRAGRRHALVGRARARLLPRNGGHCARLFPGPIVALAKRGSGMHYLRQFAERGRLLRAI